MNSLPLPWLPTRPSWDEELSIARKLSPEDAAVSLLKLSEASLDLVQTNKLDRTLQELKDVVRPRLSRAHPVRLAMIGSSTLAHLVPGIRVACARRGLWVEVFQGHYGSYHQELADPSSELYLFQPDVVLIALDAHHVVSREQHANGHTLESLKACWRLVKENLGATVIQQTVLPIFGPVLGSNEHQHSSSPHSVIEQLNQHLRRAATAEGVALLSLDHFSHAQGLAAWYEPASWHRFKQEVHPRSSALYGDYVARLLASLRGLTRKCLVLDLDNTLWGGVIGDDGVDGIRLGQGHALGEAFVSFQRYAKQLSERGIILAVCSKNDPDNAQLPFIQHSDMVLRMNDIAAFVANWDDKATNLRAIAEQLNIGLDSIVFVDDNPFERALVRRELPMVAVPEMPEDPALYETVLADAGYFEATTLTEEDRQRTQLYSENAQRDRLKATTTDLSSYLQSLNMELRWSLFDHNSTTRLVQLINRSNQFNLTTRRYSSEEVTAMTDNTDMLNLQLRLKDAFGDNGLIAVLIGRPLDSQTIEIDTWLMSCRVLGRQIEEATLNLLVEQALARGYTSIVGRFLPTAKNSMVRDHYLRLGFQQISLSASGESEWRLPTETYEAKPSFATLVSPKTLSEKEKEQSDQRTNDYLPQTYASVS